jgi:dihydropyrimidinase
VERRQIGAGGHAATRPLESEARAVSEVIELAKRNEAPVYFVHQSTPEVVDVVARAHQAGVRAFSESCPHYLTLDDSLYGSAHPERWVCCPPLRARAIVDSLDECVVAGLIDSIGSDHCCYSAAQKSERADDVRVMPNGLPGVETRLSVIFDAFVASGRISPERFVALVAANPARLNGIYPRKGTIAPGSDADIVIFDPDEVRPVSATTMHMKTDYSPYEGRSVRGWPVTVLSRGEVVVDNGRLLDPGPVGEFVAAGPIDVNWGARS